MRLTARLDALEDVFEQRKDQVLQRVFAELTTDELAALSGDLQTVGAVALANIAHGAGSHGYAYRAAQLLEARAVVQKMLSMVTPAEAALIGLDGLAQEVGAKHG